MQKVLSINHVLDNEHSSRCLSVCIFSKITLKLGKMYSSWVCIIPVLSWKAVSGFRKVFAVWGMCIKPCKPFQNAKQKKNQNSGNLRSLWNNPSHAMLQAFFILTFIQRKGMSFVMIVTKCPENLFSFV